LFDSAGSEVSPNPLSSVLCSLKAERLQASFMEHPCACGYISHAERKEVKRKEPPTIQRLSKKQKQSKLQSTGLEELSDSFADHSQNDEQQTSSCNSLSAIPLTDTSSATPLLQHPSAEFLHLPIVDIFSPSPLTDAELNDCRATINVEDLESCEAFKA
jgi:hypothetical protein